MSAINIDHRHTKGVGRKERLIVVPLMVVKGGDGCILFGTRSGCFNTQKQRMAWVPGSGLRVQSLPHHCPVAIILNLSLNHTSCYNSVVLRRRCHNPLLAVTMATCLCRAHAHSVPGAPPICFADCSARGWL